MNYVILYEVSLSSGLETPEFVLYWIFQLHVPLSLSRVWQKKKKIPAFGYSHMAGKEERSSEQKQKQALKANSVVTYFPTT